MEHDERQKLIGDQKEKRKAKKQGNLGNDCQGEEDPDEVPMEPKITPGEEVPDDGSTGFQDVPVYITCPHCNEKVVTRTAFKSGKYTYWTTACLRVFQCYCCIWIPFVLDGLKNVVHSCPKCGAELAQYKRFRWDRLLKKKKKKQQQDYNRG